MTEKTILKKIESPNNKKKKISIFDFPCDLMLDILSRLPVKTLLRLRCVSKQFLNFISDPYFRSLHYSQSSKKPFTFSMSLSYDDDRDVTILSSTDHEGRVVNSFERQFEDDFGLPINVLRSCNRVLVCISPISGNCIYLCNPNTQELVQLPPPSIRLSQRNHIGFGYVPSTKEYKVVLLFFRERLDIMMACEVLTVSTSNTYNLSSNIFSPWRRLENGCPYSVDGNLVFVNGSIHWKIKGKGWIVAFSLEDETFRILPPAPCLYFQLAGIREKLWLMKSNHEVVDMWVMKDWDRHEWVKKYSIDLLAILDGLDPVNRYFNAIWLFDIDQNEKILFNIYRHGLRRYDVTGKTIADAEEVKSTNIRCYAYYTDSFF